MSGNISVDFLYFIFYSFLGWLCEVVFCTFLMGKWVNRGFLIGPVCPVYGVGALLVILLLSPVSGSLPLTFVLGVLVTSLLEYITGFALEKLFHTKWWDYSHERFQIHGRVCLTNSLLFGVLTVIVLFFLHPRLVFWVGALPSFWVRPAAVGLGILLAADTCLSVWSVLRLNRTMAYLKEISAHFYRRLEENQQRMEEVWSDYVERMRETLNIPLETAKLKEKLKQYIRAKSYFEQFSARRLMDAFPKMRPLKLNGQLTHLFSSIEEIRQERRKERQKKKGA